MSNDGFAPVLDQNALRTLDQWSAQRGVRHRLDSWLVNGRSGAKVAIVDRHETRRGGTQKLVMKLDRIPADAATSEYARLDLAWAGSPAFAARHLTRLVNDPLNVGDGRWITFQELAGGDLGEYRLLSSLLAGFVGEAEPCTAELFARVCRKIVQGTLRDWAGSPEIDYQTVPDYLRMTLGDRLALGKPLTALLAAARPGTRGPFSLLVDASLTEGIEISAVVGRSHGDLQVENVLVQVSPKVRPGRFGLVDLAKYEERGPLARDPVHLLLHLIARTLPTLGDGQPEALLEVLVDPASPLADRLPRWLPLTVAEVRRAGDEWVRPSGFGPDWRRQWLLALVGCGLMIHVRSSTRAEDKDWFLALASRATEAFLGIPQTRSPVAPELAPRPETAAPHVPGASHVPAAPHVPARPRSAQRRSALLLANDEFTDPAFRRLTAPQTDLPGLAEVLRDPDIGMFEVTELANGTHSAATREIERFFADASVGDFLLLYFSGHGVKDAAGNLYLVATDSQLPLLGSTGIQARLIREWMNASSSRQIVVILDCCYAGAFPPGTKAGPGVDLVERLSGQGAVVLAASSAFQYAFEGDSPTAFGKLPPPSIFTGAIISGLRTGEADLDGDGWVDARELFSHARSLTLERTSLQNPQFSGSFDRPPPVARTISGPKAVSAPPEHHPRLPEKTAPEPLRERMGGGARPMIAVLAIMFMAVPVAWFAASGSDASALKADIGGQVQCDTPTPMVQITLKNTGSKTLKYTVVVGGTPSPEDTIAAGLTEIRSIGVLAVKGQQVTVRVGKINVGERTLPGCP